jgi:hypothetical protein
VSDDQDRLEFRSGLASVSCNHIALAVVGAEHDDIGARQSGIQQPLCHGLRCHRRAADGIGGIDFNQLFEDVVRILARDGIAVGCRADRLRAERAKNRNEGPNADFMIQGSFPGEIFMEIGGKAVMLS